jgi:hypothetical protein
MKIIKEGNIPPADRPWWTKQTIVCGYCKAQYQLDEGDNLAHGGERHPAGEHWVQSFCPTCKKSVTSKRVAMRGAIPENAIGHAPGAHGKATEPKLES